MHTNGTHADELIESAKRAAAYYAVKAHVRSGDGVGVGTGSTARYVVECLAELYAAGTLVNIQCVPTSFESRRLIISSHLPLSDLDQTPHLQVCIDGADECDAQLNCIKGGGGALAQEKCVMFTADKLRDQNVFRTNSMLRFYVVADYRKRSTQLGTRFAYIPLEVLPFASTPIMRYLEKSEGGTAQLRMAKMKAGPIITDNGNYILDWHFDKSRTYQWQSVNQRLKLIPGIVETGLFLNCVSAAYFGMADGTVCALHCDAQTTNGHDDTTGTCTACTAWGGVTVAAAS